MGNVKLALSSVGKPARAGLISPIESMHYMNRGKWATGFMQIIDHCVLHYRTDTLIVLYHGYIYMGLNIGYSAFQAYI